MDSRLKGGLRMLFLVAFVHLAFGAYASFSGGLFHFGATVPERYLLHGFYGEETTFNPTGSSAYHVNDLCVQQCDGCGASCFPYKRVRVDCDYCEISTSSGVVIAREGDFFAAVASNLVVVENVTFRCYWGNETSCGFEEKLLGNYTLLHTF